MANYPQQVSAADYTSLVTQVRERLASWSEETSDAVDAEDDNILQRIDHLLDEVLVVTSVQNEIVVPRKLIVNLTEAITAVDEALTALDGVNSSTVTVPLVNDLTNAAEALAATLFQWPPRIEGENWREAVTLAASTYRRSAGQQLAGLSVEIDAAKAELARIDTLSLDLADKTSKRAEEKQSELTAQLMEVEGQIERTSSSLKAASTQIETAIDRSETAIGTQQERFAKAQEERSKAFTAAVEEQSKISAATLAEQDTAAAAVVQELHEKLGDAKTLVEVFTAAGTANAYSREARAQGKQANIWRAIAITLGVLTALAAGFVLVEIPRGTSLDTWQLLLGKLAIGATLGTVAGYAARQSSRHRRREERAKHLELNLETFGSLAGELSTDKLEEARSALVAAMLKEQENPPSRGARRNTVSDS